MSHPIWVDMVFQEIKVVKVTCFLDWITLYLRMRYSLPSQNTRQTGTASGYCSLRVFSILLLKAHIIHQFDASVVLEKVVHVGIIFCYGITVYLSSQMILKVAGKS